MDGLWWLIRTGVGVLEKTFSSTQGEFVSGFTEAADSHI